MSDPPYPSLYQVNARVWLTDLSRSLGRAATLDDVPDAALDRLAALGFDWVWFLSVWRTGPAGQRISRTHPGWRAEFQAMLPDLQEADIAGSGFAIRDYVVPADLGGDAALARLRERLAKRRLKLMLDFVPNHVALDHPWVDRHPEYFIAGSADMLAKEPQNYVRVGPPTHSRVLAHGRDPYFAGWPDTLQLDYSNPRLQAAMMQELLKVAGQCDGVRCDMAMLLLPDVFDRTWGRRPEPFWPGAIQRIRDVYPDFCFLAEVYWDLEWTLQQQGFDYTYDKRLYDRLRDGRARPVREHLHAAPAYQNRLARFLENHDEPRAASVFEPRTHRAAAVIAYLAPGLRFFHEGQLEGRRMRISPHLVRAPEEPPDPEMTSFYGQLLALLQSPAARRGAWQPLDCTEAGDGNGSWDSFVAYSWRGPSGEHLLTVVNYADQSSQCFVKMQFPELQNRSIRLADRLGPALYARQGNDLLERGLFVDLPPWSYHAFEVQ